MNFTSFHFLAFFVLTIFFGHILKNRTQKVFLLLASYYFYGVFEPTYLYLILCSTTIDYIAALGISAKNLTETRPILFSLLGRLKKRSWLIISLVMNTGLLAYFKYTNFGIEVLNDLQPFGETVFAWPSANILLPIGISFYTFQSMSYTIDVYRGNIRARTNFLDFALYVSFFPQLVAGPIVRASTFLKQLDNRLPVAKQDIIVGTTRIVVGFFRKLVLADNLSIVVNSVFASPMRYGPLDIWIASIAFGFQIYFDFAGYTDIARGVARLFGFEFEINFLYPMAARNITEHWQRWHISLTSWMRDYVYIPLGGSRVGNFRLFANIFMIWFLVGLWHGSSYHFIIWGIWQAVMISIHRIYSTSEIKKRCAALGGRFYSAICSILTIFFLNFGFIMFRARDMNTATVLHGREFGIYNMSGVFLEIKKWLLFNGNANSVFHHLTGPVEFSFPTPVYSSYLILLALYFIYEYTMNKLQLDYFWRSENKIKLIFMLVFMIFCIIVFSNPETPSFMYFQF